MKPYESFNNLSQYFGRNSDSISVVNNSNIIRNVKKKKKKKLYITKCFFSNKSTTSFMMNK